MTDHETIKDAPAGRRKGVAWASVLLTLSRAWSQVVNLILLLVAARVLTPAELGAFGLVSITVLIMHQAAETGWYEYAANRPASENLAPELFWCAVGAGLTAMIVAAGAAGGVYVIFGSETYAIVMLVLCVMPFLGAFTSVQIGVHTRRGDVVKIPLTAIPAETAGLAIGAWALLNDYGVLALAFHKVTTMGLIAIGVSAWSGWFAPLAFQASRGWTILRFSARLLMSRTAGFVQHFGADYLVGALLGLTEVGLFRAGGRIAGSLAEMVAEPSRLIAWTILPRNAIETPFGRRAPDALSDLIVTILVIAMPAFVGLALIAEDAVLLLLGPGWSDAALVLVFLALAKSLFVFISLVQPVMVIAGEERLLPRLTMANAAITLTSLLVLGWQGVYWAAASQLVAALLIAPILVYVFRRFGGLDLRRTAIGVLKVALAVGLMAVAILVFRESVFSQGPGVASDGAQTPLWLRLPSSILVGASVYLIALAVLRPRPVAAMLASIRLRGLSFIKRRQVS